MKEPLTIKHDPNGTLRKSCKPVKTIGPKVQSITNNLIDCMMEHQEDDIRPVSIAAPQLGVSSRVIAFFPNHLYAERDGIEILINPEITKARKFLVFTETCLSIPGKTYKVRRASSVKVKGLNLAGRPVSYKASGLFAQALQHEIDHLNGVLIDKIGELVKE